MSSTEAPMINHAARSRHSEVTALWREIAEMAGRLDDMTVGELAAHIDDLESARDSLARVTGENS